MQLTLNIRREKKHNNNLILNPEEKNFIIFLKFSKKKIQKFCLNKLLKIFKNLFYLKNVVFATMWQ